MTRVHENDQRRTRKNPRKWSWPLRASESHSIAPTTPLHDDDIGVECVWEEP